MAIACTFPEETQHLKKKFGPCSFLLASHFVYLVNLASFSVFLIVCSKFFIVCLLQIKNRAAGKIWYSCDCDGYTPTLVNRGGGD